MKKRNILILAIILLTLSSCAPEGYSQHEYGFFGGLWHGLILLYSLIGKFFGGDIGVFADNNTGFTYWFGFIFGLLGTLGGVASTSR